MSFINKTRPRTRVNSRANTLPPPSSLISATINSGDTDEFLPSIEESLQDWLNKSIPDTPSVAWLLNQTCCRCCNKSNCENLELLSSAIRKLESDSRLAAEIGQSLLAKHEKFVSQSNEIKNGLEQELEDLRTKVCELEQSLYESDTLKQDLIQEKDKFIWEWQKTQKILDETVIDLENSNDRCIQLGSELKLKMNEVEKLRIFKFMARQADIREDNLRAKLEDIKQELAVSRKQELILESKYKKLKTKYESICFSFEKLKLDQQEMGLTKDHQLDIVWLRESNEKLRKDVLKLTSALLVNGGSNHTLNETTNNLIQLIKELASANNKLKSDLLDCSDLLMECRNDLYLKLKQEEEEGIMHHDDIYAASPTATAAKEVPASDDLLWLQKQQQQPIEEEETAGAEETDDETKVGVVQKQQHNNSSDFKNNKQQIDNSATSAATSAATIVHHHYHYYMKNKILAAAAEKKRGKRKSISYDNETQAMPNITVSSSATTQKVDTSSPFRQLYNQVTNVLTRLQQTDIRALNRRLKRAFDMIELSSMSNSIIENIVMDDVDGIRTRFLWIEQEQVKEEAWIHDISMMEFFPMIGLVQDMLKEIGHLRVTMNELQVEYVKKVEESDIRLSQDIKRKQEEEAAAAKVKASNSNEKASPIATWFTKVFNNSSRSSSSSNKVDQSQQQHGVIDNNSRYMINNSSDISIKTTHSNSVHPLSTTSPVEKSNMIAIIRRKKSDILIDRHGPPSSFPSRSSLPPSSSVTTKKRRSTATAILSPSSASPVQQQQQQQQQQQYQPIPIIRASQSAGTVRKSKSMQAPALDYYVVRRKRSNLGLSSSTMTAASDNGAGSSNGGNNNNMTFATTSWLGNK